MKAVILIVCSYVLLTSCLNAQPFDAKYFNALQWRMIGPHRGGRTVGAVGVPQQPNVFYIGVNNGGVWKTNDFGRTWNPIFDDQPTGSIGDVAVAPSNPNIVYVGSGEGLQRPDLSVGDGIYKSTDAGTTWIHLGLQKAQQIGGLCVDPTNENRVFVAALGHPYGANEERGIYRTLDGGKTWEKVLYKDENTGAIQVAIDPNNPQIVFADLWASRLGPWENGEWQGKESGLFKSTDGGTTWKKLTMGLPTTDSGLGRIGFCIAPSNSKRMYATVDAGAKGGIYKSDDAGESWTRIQSDERYWGRGSDFAEVKVDPKNPDIVYTANVVTWKSTDGGTTWGALRGAPGGDDYHRIWINPNNPDIYIIAGDQGAIITVNGGNTFSSWYNQPTAQCFHVSADNAFPYNVYSGQQESGSIGIASRGNDGEITFREWHPVGAEEYGYVVADPLDPNIVYGGKISRYDKRTGQTQNISPGGLRRGGEYRFIRTAPIIFSPIDSKTLYYAGNVLFKTTNGGNSWDVISPDLSRESWDIPANVGIYNTTDLKTMKRRGVIYTVAPSFKNKNTIWCGTDDGLIHITRDGGTNWKNVTPPEITSWSKVSIIDASHFDANTAYAAVNRIRCDDMHPYIYKTTDGGATWKLVVNGLPDDPINVVREDPQRQGLLFAGSERAVYISFDDGEHWQSLRLNMPATSIRDLVIKDDDIVVGTHGRSFWILDDITMLRQLRASLLDSSAILYQPQTAYRVRWNTNTDTPLPQEEPAGQNPPEGAIIDYYLNADMKDVTLELRDEHNTLVRTYCSNDTLYAIPPSNIPPYWIRPRQVLSAAKGAHRWLWDMHYQPFNESVSYPMSAVYMNTDPAPNSPWVMPGKYVAILTAAGHTYKQSFTIVMDPRVTTSRSDLQQQHDLSLQCYRGRMQCDSLAKTITAYCAQLQARLSVAAPADTQHTSVMLKTGRTLINAGEGNKAQDFNKLTGTFASLMGLLQGSDTPVTEQAVAAVKNAVEEMKELIATWEMLGREAGGK